MRRPIPSAWWPILSALAAPAFAIDEYRLDDGIKETGIGIQSTGSNSIAWLNHFVVQPGFETITAIRVAYGGGLAATNIGNGTPAMLYLWDDFNQDGDPSDAFVLASVAGLVAGTGTNALNTYTLTPPVTLTAGQSIFAGAIIHYNGQVLVASLDTDGTDDIVPYPPNFHSWIAGSANGVPVDPNALALAQLPVALVANAIFGGGGDGTWMIRLNAAGSGGTPALTFSPDPLDFGAVDKQALSAPMAVTFLNTGTATLSVTGIAPASPPFQHVAGTCPPLPFLLPPAASCTHEYVFAPLGTGTYAQTIAIVSNDPASPHDLTLIGLGTIFDDGFE